MTQREQIVCVVDAIERCLGELVWQVRTDKAACNDQVLTKAAGGAPRKAMSGALQGERARDSTSLSLAPPWTVRVLAQRSMAHHFET